ncbi:ParB N-terminal domain-containing protein [Moraxella sp. ZJ142]|uniref:ParB N-terminal domain-containing protein n=1 Tax=Moraxella marmotae TaxID=3344520 RepID=UPI0035D3E7CE
MAKSKHQKYEMATMWRSQIQLHPKNPRHIDEQAQKNLKTKMEEVGLLQPLIVNQKTGYLLGGHQRLAVLDKIERYKDGKNDYELDVSLVYLDEKAELEMLVFLNNPSAQGTWDKDLLAELNLDFGINFDDMGFSRLDVDLMFDGDSRFAGSELFEDTAEVQAVKADLQEIKEHRKESTEKLKQQNNIDYYFTVVCRNQKEKAEILKLVNIPEHENYISVDAIKGYIERGRQG